MATLPRFGREGRIWDTEPENASGGKSLQYERSIAEVKRGPVEIPEFVTATRTTIFMRSRSCKKNGRRAYSPGGRVMQTLLPLLTFAGQRKGLRTSNRVVEHLVAGVLGSSFARVEAHRDLASFARKQRSG